MPDAREVLEGLIGRELRTPVHREPNWIRAVENGRVRVATASNAEGGLVPIALVQSALDRIYAGEEYLFDPRARSAFLGAVLAEIPEVEVLTEPRRARLRAAPFASPDWTFDELILALDLYLRWRPHQPPAGHRDLERLSDLLRRLPIHTRNPLPTNFRSTGSVRRKLGDFTDPDPTYAGKGTNGGAGVHLIWDEFAEDQQALATAVEQIAATADSAALPPPDEVELSAVEGRILMREHRIRERDTRLVRSRKALALRKHGRLACEVCEMDFVDRYGELGAGYIEAHHTTPLAAGPARATRVEDLALLCANCHAMIHRGKPRTLTLDQLRRQLRP